VPVFTLERVEGRIFRPVALTFAFALGGALVFTLTCVPALMVVLLRHGKVRHVEPRFLVFLRERYLAALRRALKHPAFTCLAGVALLAMAVVLVPRLGTEFLPEMNEGDIHITVTMPPETSLERGAQRFAT
jgi:cobalt-zinc-cadmium resistance protein CzcA